MSKTMKFLVAAGLVAVITAGGAAIPIMAADTPTPTASAQIAPRPRQTDLMDKTAVILGISNDTLTNAFKQVQEEAKSAIPPVDDYHTRVAKILGISVETLTNAEKQAFEAAKGTAPAQNEGVKDNRMAPPAGRSADVAKILGITTETLVAAEKQARTEIEAEMKAKTPAAAPAKDEMLGKVAQILDITTEKLTAAMQQASKEIEQANLDSQLANAVTNNTITQDESNQIKDWLAKKPVALDKLPDIGAPFMGGMMGPGGRGMGPGNAPGNNGLQSGAPHDRLMYAPSPSPKTN